MGYYWITQAQLYIQSLGFGSALPAVNKRQQQLRINQYGGDNSFYRDGTKKLTITLGKGGVDDAEDAEVIVHEYGHSVQDDQVPGFGTSLEAGAIGEAFSDYLAVTVTTAVTRLALRAAVRRRLGRGLLHAARRGRTASAASTATSTTRRTSRTRSTPTARCGRQRCGAPAGCVGDSRLADKVIILAQFDFAPGTSFRGAALATIAAAGDYGVADEFRQAFTERGFLG